jgi:hypothetical protein
MAVSSGFAAGFRPQALTHPRKVLHKPGPARLVANVRQTTKEKIRKPLILLMILKIAGQILQNLYIPEYAEHGGPASFAQSYPQKSRPVGSSQRLSWGGLGIHR